MARVKTLKMYVDDSGDWIVVFKTDLPLNYAVSISHKLMHDSYSLLQGKALCEVLKFAEPGEKMDESIFLQHCARLKRQFNLVKINRQNNVLVASVIPTRLSPSESG
eukprot:gene37612-45186_t